MGDVSIIARRLEGGQYVQYGWSGNGGYYSTVGARLLYWYDDPEQVEYLFSLGQLRWLGEPDRKHGGKDLDMPNIPDGMPHWLGDSERCIFSQIAFVDFGYFYDLDHTWYYIVPGPFRIKIPLKYIDKHLDESDYEFDELRRIKRKAAEYILGNYYEVDEVFRSVVAEEFPDGIETLRADVLSDQDDPLYRFWDRYRVIFRYFDDWIVVSDPYELVGM